MFCAQPYNILFRVVPDFEGDKGRFVFRAYHVIWHEVAQTGAYRYHRMSEPHQQTCLYIHI